MVFLIVKFCAGIVTVKPYNAQYVRDDHAASQMYNLFNEKGGKYNEEAMPSCYSARNLTPQSRHFNVPRHLSDEMYLISTPH